MPLAARPVVALTLSLACSLIVAACGTAPTAGDDIDPAAAPASASRAPAAGAARPGDGGGTALAAAGCAADPSAAAAARARLVGANNAFALELYARLREEPGNLVFSPASISLAFGMTYAGARGETASEMARALEFDRLSRDGIQAGFAALLAAWNDPDRTSYRLRVANRLFGDAGTSFHEPFLALTRECYGAELEQLDLQGAPEPSRERINEWVARQTEEKIRDLLPPGSITPDSRLVLTNAIYFKGTWLLEFDEDATRPLPFRTREGSRDVATMHQTGRFGYAEMDGVQVLRMPYEGEELAMFVLLPRDADGLGRMEERMTPESLSRWMDGVRAREVRVWLPRFKLEPPAPIALRPLLMRMGMERAFRRTADFGGMSALKPLFISDAFHKAFVEVNEEGTEAAAATGVVMMTESVRPEPLEFRADHPFLFVIREEGSGSILFLGRVSDPGA